MCYLAVPGKKALTPYRRPSESKNVTKQAEPEFYLPEASQEAYTPQLHHMNDVYPHGQSAKMVLCSSFGGRICNTGRFAYVLCPRGDGPHEAVVECRGNPAGTLQAALNPAVAKAGVKMTPDGHQSVLTLIRTSATRDRSQKAEKVYRWQGCYWKMRTEETISHRILHAPNIQYIVLVRLVSFVVLGVLRYFF